MSQPQEGLTEAEQRDRRAAIPAIFAKTPFLSRLGLVVERYEPDDVATRLPFRFELSNGGSTYHGGVVGAVMDTTGQRSRMTLPVMSAAASETKYAITSATSFGVATRRPAERAAAAVWVLIQPVSVMGGWTTFAVTPWRASSLAALRVKLT